MSYWSYTHVQKRSHVTINQLKGRVSSVKAKQQIMFAKPNNIDLALHDIIMQLVFMPDFHDPTLATKF